MDIVEKNPNLIEFGGCVRIERGPVLKTAIASLDLVRSGKLAPHYKLTLTRDILRAIEAKVLEADPGLREPSRRQELARAIRDNIPAGYAARSADKFNKPIIAGQEFSYLDWKGDQAWHLYEYATEDWTGPNTVTLDDDGNPIPVFDEAGNPVLDGSGRQKVETHVGPAWRRRAHYFDKTEAMIAAKELAEAIAAAGGC